MRSPNFFLIKPYNGDRYRTEEDGLIINASIENHEYTNRIAEVIETPTNYKGIIEKGDLVVVHHNAFRVMRTQMGKMTSSNKHIVNDLFYTENPYMVIKNEEMISINPYIFLSQISYEDEFMGQINYENIGKIEVNSEEHDKMGLKKGDKVIYKDFRNYKFNLFGKEYIKMDTSDILAKTE